MEKAISFASALGSRKQTGKAHLEKALASTAMRRSSLCIQETLQVLELYAAEYVQDLIAVGCFRSLFQRADLKGNVKTDRKAQLYSVLMLLEGALMETISSHSDPSCINALFMQWKK